VNGVVLEQVSECGHVAEVVGSNEFNVGVAVCGTGEVSADAAETVDCYTNSHGGLLVGGKFCGN